MITQEQAEQTFKEKYPDDNMDIIQIRNIKYEQIDLEDADVWNSIEAFDTGPFDALPVGWKVTFERRYRQMDARGSLGCWFDWHKDACYIVESKPGIYII